MWSLFKILKGSKGYTLTEMTAVVATAGILTAVMLPVAVSQVQQGRITAAGGDLSAISSAVSSLLRDTGDYPMRSGPKNTFDSRYAFTLLRSTGPDGIVVAEPDISILGTITSKGTFEPHFFSNSVEYSTVGDQQWRGPYISKRGFDPWGHSYLIYLEGVREAANPDNLTHTTLKNIIVISAGANGVVETAPTDNSPKGDDIITILGRRT